jgi:hypothetical protein
MKSKRFAIAPLLVGAIAVLASCGIGKPIAAPGAQPASPPRPASSVAPQTRAGGAPVPGGAVQAQAAAAQAPNQPQFQGAAGVQPVPPVNRMVIKNGSLSLSVRDPEASLGNVDQLVAAEQGIIASQTIRSQDDKTFVNLVIQVPPDNFEETLAKLRELRAQGTRVLDDTVNSQDVTGQFVDLEAQYTNLQATRDAYQKLLDKASALSDVISLTREIGNIQTQMDQIKSRQNLLSGRAAISTISVSLSPIGASPSVGPRPLPKPIEAAQSAWQALQTGLQGLAVVLIWMAILLPIPAAVLTLGWVAYRRATRGATLPG